jgi:choline transporter-like protein 2/4/5
MFKTHDKDYKGEKVDDSVMNGGPVENRGCTDILFCILFILSSFVLVYIASYGLANGDPNKLTYAYDPNGYGCGESSVYETLNSVKYDYKEYKYLYFVAPK